MKRYPGVSFAAAILVSCGMPLVKSAQAAPRFGAVATQPMTLTEVVAARHAHRPHRGYRLRRHRARVYVRGPYQSYYGRPDYYVPAGRAPFFPFGFGYGLDPSW
ncbi:MULTISPECIES: hypothetical protein [unclassified Nitrobacter]|uniref:hypothetical protein n=1 Tax=unclassified Nitrobacter TaxID=2620411 RepID=UPI000E2EF12C|nr:MULTISPECIES: hypothetical protein [unclassified Nitrobacter]MCV0385462.1 hypothetical protein [Nitrobacter sp.]